MASSSTAVPSLAPELDSTSSAPALVGAEAPTAGQAARRVTPQGGYQHTTHIIPFGGIAQRSRGIQTQRVRLDGRHHAVTQGNDNGDDRAPRDS